MTVFTPGNKSGQIKTAAQIKEGEQVTGADQIADVLALAADRATRYAQSVPERRVSPSAEAVAALSQFHEKFPDHSTPPGEVIAMLDDVGSVATVATTGGRYFGFVIGGSLPAATAASWLTSAWDQNMALRVMSPVSAELEDVVLGWIRELLGLPADCDGGLLQA